MTMADRRGRYDYLRTASELGVHSVRDVVLRLFRLDGDERGDELWMLCPVHTDTHPSASVSCSTGFWHCFSCGAGGDLISLGVRALDRSPEDIEDLLESRTPDALLAMLGSLEQLHTRRRAQERIVVPQPADYTSGPLYELIHRGFTMETLRRWDVRYVASETLDGARGPFNIFASIGIPIEDTRGQVLAWCYRRTEASPRWQPRYLYSTGAAVESLWFGTRHHARVRSIVVVEGALDAMWCDQAGIPALAMLGSAMTGPKLHRLADYDTVTILADYDTAGVRAVRKIGQAVGDRVSLRVARYAGWMRAKDPQELSPVDLELIVERAEPWARFVARAHQGEAGIPPVDHGRRPHRNDHGNHHDNRRLDP